MVIERRDEILGCLVGIATLDSAVDELNRSVSALAGAAREIQRHSPSRPRQVAVFLPSNNVLYSYVLFGLVPALYSHRVDIRPSARVADVACAIHEILDPEVRRVSDADVRLTAATQREFLDVCRSADAILFAGRHHNGISVARAAPREAVTLLFGSGPNPCVVGPEADIEAVVDDVVAARLYNVGQDCLCPDIVFVHDLQLSRFVDALSSALELISRADRTEPGVNVAPLVYPDAVIRAAAFVAEHEEWVVRGGGVDVETGFVEPTVVAPPSAHLHPPELFSPIFLVVGYADATDVVSWLTSPEEVLRGMYACVYGEPELPRGRIGTTIVAEACTTFDVEDGNKPFGGYGIQASSVVRGSAAAGRPLLLSAELGAARARSGGVDA